MPGPGSGRLKHFLSKRLFLLVKRRCVSIGKIFLRFLSYIINILLTVLLIGLISGMVVGSTFAYYVKNYIDADISEFDMINTGQNMTTKIYYMNWSDRENRIGVPGADVSGILIEELELILGKENVVLK